MINKKKLFKSLIIIALIIIIIFAIVQIRQTLARYETVTQGEGDVDVAFWVVDNDVKTGRIILEDLYPREEPFEYTFTISNFNEDGKRAETDLEYDILITTSTYLPLSYEVTRNGMTCINEGQLYIDVDDTYYRVIRLETDTNNFTMDCDNDQTDTFTIKVTFPEEYSSNPEYADLIEDIKIELSARQIIDE